MLEKLLQLNFFPRRVINANVSFISLPVKKNSTLAEVCNTAKHSPKKQILVILATTMEVLHSS